MSSVDVGEVASERLSIKEIGDGGVGDCRLWSGLIQERQRQMLRETPVLLSCGLGTLSSCYSRVYPTRMEAHSNWRYLGTYIKTGMLRIAVGG